MTEQPAAAEPKPAPPPTYTLPESAATGLRLAKELAAWVAAQAWYKNGPLGPDHPRKTLADAVKAVGREAAALAGESLAAVPPPGN